MRQWLPAGHPVWLVIEAVRRLDTRVFHTGRRTGGAGAAGYDPDMLVTLLIWAYANGITSSRRIERLCQQDVAFRVICAGHVPDHVTVARFRQLFAETAADLFAEVLVLCARLGMGRVGTVALDGTKIAASASKDANRTEEELRKLAAELAAAHAEADAQEDALFGTGRRGDDDPGDPFTRMERVAAALADLAAERQAREAAERAAAQAHLEAARAGAPVQGRRQAAAEVALAEVKVAREIAAYQGKVAARQEAVAAGRRSPGGPQPVPAEEYCRVRRARAGLERARARQAARAERRRGRREDRAGPAEPHRPGLQAHAGPRRRVHPGIQPAERDSADGLVIATRLTNSPTDVQWYEDMIRDAGTAAAAMAAAGGPGDGAPGLVLADAGYLSRHNLTCPGPDRLIATGKHRDLENAARAAAQDTPGTGQADDDPIAAMTARLATPAGITAYRRRSHIGETFHADLKHNQGLRRLSVAACPEHQANGPSPPPSATSAKP